MNVYIYNKWNFLNLSSLSNGEAQRQCHGKDDENSNNKLLLLQKVAATNFDLLSRYMVYTNVGEKKHTWRILAH